MENTIQSVTLLATLAATTISYAASTPIAVAKLDPAGIIRLFSTSVAKPANSPSWTNPNVDGMRARPGWSDVQPGQTTFDWSAIDEMLSLGAQHGKLIGVSVAAGVNSPQWVYTAGATRYVLSDGSGAMPIPWDEAFLTQWLAFVRALGARYDGNPALGYVVMSGMGQNVETYMAKTSADSTRLTALGGAAAWTGAAKKIIAAYASAFPTTPFFITAAKPFDSVDGLSALQEVVDWGVATYPGRFGIMNASLNAHSTTVYYPNLAVYTYCTTQPVGFQLLCSEAEDRARLGGTLAQALTAGVKLGAKFIEVYQADADRPANQQVLATEGAALKRNLAPQAPTNLHIP